MPEFNITKCSQCGKLHQVRIRAKKKYEGEWTKWKPACSPACLLKLPWLSDPTCTVEGLTQDELEAMVGAKNTKEGRMKVVDAKFEDE